MFLICSYFSNAIFLKDVLALTCNWGQKVQITSFRVAKKLKIYEFLSNGVKNRYYEITKLAGERRLKSHEL